MTDAVRQLVNTGDKHLWSLDELHARVREDIATANFSTILRAVSALERGGEVDRVDLGDGKARYERHGGHHDHVRCTSCGRVAEVPGCVLDEATALVQSATSFVIGGHQLTFSGVCPECASGRARVAAVD